MPQQRALTLLDIPWLRLCARKAGALSVPAEIATKLLSGGLVEAGGSGDCLMITKRGQIALSRLG